MTPTLLEMTRRDIFNRFYEAASLLYDEREAQSIAWLVVEELYGLTKAEVALYPAATAQWDEKAQLAVYCISQGRPVQYVIGKTEFCGMEFTVREGVLIPRPETEELVRWILEEQPRGVSVLDMGSGSGAIAVALAKKIPDSRVTGLDISAEAISTGRQNALLNGVNVEFFRANVLFETYEVAWVLAGSKFDVIVSNPPYIPVSERESMHPNVTDYEPSTALFVPESDPLIFYRAIAGHGKKLLNAGGHIYFETHERMAGDVARLMESEGYHNIEIRKDIHGKDRMVRCVRS